MSISSYKYLIVTGIFSVIDQCATLGSHIFFKQGHIYELLKYHLNALWVNSFLSGLGKISPSVHPNIIVPSSQTDEIRAHMFLWCKY